MSDLDPRVRALVDAARAAGPTAADRARIRAALATRLVPAAGAAASSSGAGVSLKGALATAPAGVGAKLIAAGAVIGVTCFGGGLLVGRRGTPAALARHGLDMHAMVSAHVAERRMDEAKGAPAPEVEPPAPAPTPDPIPEPSPEARVPPRRIAARPTAKPAPVEPAAGSAVTVADPPSPETSSLLEETAAPRRAQMSLGAGDARAALARLDELGARHPDGLLREERLAARILALCAAGRAAEARREAARFLAEAPLSIHAARVRASCASGPGGDPGP